MKTNLFYTLIAGFVLFCIGIVGHFEIVTYVGAGLLLADLTINLVITSLKQIK